MTGRPYIPTAEQREVIAHEGSAFVVACPGAGKTRVIVERAAQLIQDNSDGRGVALLSFTNAAVAQIEHGLRLTDLRSSVRFPHFVGTFDSFIWQFLVAPFGSPGRDIGPRLVPEKYDREVRPFKGARPIPLKCFDRETGRLIADAAMRMGVDFARNPHQLPAFETAAGKLLARFRELGELDFEDARIMARLRLADGDFAKRLAQALHARFREFVIDEAQDCNPEDLEIIRWLRRAGIATKVVCDPNQSIYAFRGGVSGELMAFSEEVDHRDRLPLTGNFRSSPSICKAISAFRPHNRRYADEALGQHRADSSPVIVLAYAGAKVPGTIGSAFSKLAESARVEIDDARVLAATRSSGASAVGHSTDGAVRDLTFRFAQAISAFHLAFESGGQGDAIAELQKVVLDACGFSDDEVTASGVPTRDRFKPSRGEAVRLARALRYSSELFPDADAWLTEARRLLAPLLPEGGRTIAQRLKKNEALLSVLSAAQTALPRSMTIHAAKGQEFPAVCVVTVASTLKGILDYLETGVPAESAEFARQLYVAASRAERLLVIAAPRSQSGRLVKTLETAGATVTEVSL